MHNSESVDQLEGRVSAHNDTIAMIQDTLKRDGNHMTVETRAQCRGFIETLKNRVWLLEREIKDRKGVV